MRQGINKEWFKHWFVLKNNALTYYRDSCAVKNSILDGVLDLALVHQVQERSNDKYFPFVLTVSEIKISRQSDCITSKHFSSDVGREKTHSRCI